MSDEIIEIAICLFCHWAMHRIVTIFSNLEELTPERHGRLEEFKRGKGIFARGVTVQIKADAEEVRETIAFVVVNRKREAQSIIERQARPLTRIGARDLARA